MPGTRRRTSGTVVAPLMRISSAEMMVKDAGARISELPRALAVTTCSSNMSSSALTWPAESCCESSRAVARVLAEMVSASNMSSSGCAGFTAAAGTAPAGLRSPFPPPPFAEGCGAGWACCCCAISAWSWARSFCTSRFCAAGCATAGCAGPPMAASRRAITLCTFSLSSGSVATYWRK